MQTRVPVTILSAERAGLRPSQNEWRTTRLRRDLAMDGVAYSEADGCYSGTCERSFIVVTKGGEGSDDWGYVVRKAREWHQESVLHVDANGYATLYFLETGKHEPLGSFQELPEAVAKQASAFTRTRDGRYFVAFPLGAMVPYASVALNHEIQA
jgi:hypothetical protein